MDDATRRVGKPTDGLMSGIELIRGLGACDQALVWCETQRGVRLDRVWRKCDRADWLLWIAASVGVDRRLVVRAACACAREVLPAWEAYRPGDARPRVAIETAEAWTRGEATLSQAQVAASAASAASAAASVASAAASVAASAASAASASVFVAASAASAASASVFVAVFAAGGGARRRMSFIVRRVIPWRVVQAAAWPENAA